MSPFHGPQDEWKGKGLYKSPCTELAPSRAQSGTAACPTTLSLQPVATLGPHNPPPRLKTSQFGRPQPHVRSSEQVPPQCCPSYPSTTKITSFILISAESPKAQAEQPHWEQTPPNTASNMDTASVSVQSRKALQPLFSQAPRPQQKGKLTKQENYGLGPALTRWMLKRSKNLHWLTAAKLLPQSARPNRDKAPSSQVRVLWSLTAVWVTRKAWKVLVRNCFFHVWCFIQV